MTKSSESAVQVTHISIVAEAVRSVEHVLSQVQNPDKLSSVCLHGNLLTSCSNFAQLSALTDLNLSANRITSVQDLGKLPQLVNLNLSSNRLVNLDGLPPLPNLSRISVAHNKLTCLSGLRALDGGCLHTADVRSNRLSELRSLAVFANMPSLRNLSISGGVSGNPVASVAGLQAAVAAALPQLAAFQTLPAFHQSSAVDVHPHYPAVPSSVPRTIQHLDPLSACENDPVAANVSHNTPVQLCHKDPEPQPRQQLSDPEITPPAGKQKAGSHEEVQDGWQAHERRLAALEASLLERASMASKTLSHAAGSIRQECADASTQSSPPPKITKARCESTAVQTLPPVDPPELAQLRSQCSELEVELHRAVEALEQHVLQDQRNCQQAAEKVAIVEANAAEQVEAARKFAEESVAIARREQEKAAWQVTALQSQLDKAESSAAEGSSASAALQARVRDLEHARAAAELDLERERLKREGSESKRLVAALDEVALLQRQLATVRGDAERAAASEERLRADKESLDAALARAQADVHAVHRQSAKVADDLTAELAKVRREKCDTEQRLQERSIIEQDLKSECSKLASALAACQTANEAAIQRVQEAAAAHEQEALSLARTSAYQEASKAAEQTQQHELEQAKRQCETLAAELEACKLDHRRTLDVVRADTEQLLRDNEILAAEASALKQGTAELVDERARSDSEKDAVVRELMELVQQQRVTLKQNKEQIEDQQRKLADPTLVAELTRLQQALQDARLQVERQSTIAAEAQSAAKAATERAKEAEDRSTTAVQRADAASAAAADKAAAAEEAIKHVEERVASAQQGASDAADELKIKKVLLENALEQVSELKVELDEAMQDAMDARAALEDQNAAHGERVVELEQQVEEARHSVGTAEEKVTSAEQRLLHETGRAKELEVNLQKLKDTLKERDNMLKEVETGMDQVKELYGRKVERVERERSEALEQNDDLQRKLQKVEASLTAARKEYQLDLAAAQDAKLQAVADAECHSSTAKASERRVVEVENEMRALLEAFDKERAQSALRAQQLQDVIKLWK